MMTPVTDMGGSYNAAVSIRCPFHTGEAHRKSYAHLPKHSARYSTSATDSGPPTKLGQYAVFEMIKLSASHGAETLTGTKSCRIQYVHVK